MLDELPCKCSPLQDCAQAFWGNSTTQPLFRSSMHKDMCVLFGQIMLARLTPCWMANTATQLSFAVRLMSSIGRPHEHVQNPCMSHVHDACLWRLPSHLCHILA